MELEVNEFTSTLACRTNWQPFPEGDNPAKNWVAVKELKLSYHNGYI